MNFWHRYSKQYPTMALGVERSASILRYMSRCPVTDKDHDWRYASHAPGWINGDDCAFCQDCEQRAIKPLEAKNEL